MKIAYFLTSLANAGPINVALDLVNVMTEHGHEVEVFYFKDIVQNSFPCPVYQITMSTKVDLCRFDLVHSHGLICDIYLLSHLPFSRKHRPKYFTTIHSFIFEDHLYAYGPVKSFFTTRLTIAATNRADKVITLGKTAMEYYSKHISPKRLTWAYNTRTIDPTEQIDPEDVELIQGFKSRFKFTFGTICAFYRRKALEQLVKVLPELPHAGLLLVGDGEIRTELEELAESLSVKDRILFLGSRSKGYRYLSQMDIFVLPSRSEGFPLALLEAACASKPCVTSDIDVHKEFFTDDETVKFHLDDIVSLKQAIEKCYARKDSYASALNKRYIKDYSPISFYNRHLAIYTDGK